MTTRSSQAARIEHIEVPRGPVKYTNRLACFIYNLATRKPPLELRGFGPLFFRQVLKQNVLRYFGWCVELDCEFSIGSLNQLRVLDLAAAINDACIGCGCVVFVFEHHRGCRLLRVYA